MTRSYRSNHHLDGDNTRSVERRRDSSSSKHLNKETATVALVPYIPRPVSPHKPRVATLLSLTPCTSNRELVPPSSPTIISDIVPHILSYMDAITLSRASITCKSWNTLANCNELWNELCKDKFGVMASELNPPPDPTRTLYVMSHLRMKEAFYGTATATMRRDNNNVISSALFRQFFMQQRVNA